MRNTTEIEPTERIVLECACGELLILLGSREDWLLEERDSFECGACGSRVPLPSRGASRGTEPGWVGLEEAESEEVEPWIGPSSNGSGDHSARKLIQELRAANGG